MSKILTPNVFITNNYEIAKSFFLDGVYTNVEQLPEVEGALVITSKRNKYLQSLEYSINFDNENNPSLTLEFLDTDGNFEQEFFMHRSNTVFKAMQRRLQDERARQSRLTVSSTLNTGGTGIDTSQSEPKLIDEFEYANQFNKIYFAFGTDSLLSNWSDLLTVYLNKTNIDISNGLRKYIFKFFASNDSVLRPKLVFNLNDPNPSREFVFTENIDEFLADLKIDQSVDTIENVIYRLVKKYVSILTATEEGNIIGILPKLFNNSEIPGTTEFKPPATSTPSEPVFNSPKVSLIVPQILLTKNYGIDTASYYNSLSARAQRQITAPGTSVRPNAPEADKENNQGNKFVDAYIMRCKNNRTSDLHPAFPNFYEPLNKLNIAIKSQLRTADNFVVVQENNVRILKYWESKGLIKSAKNKCIIFGLEEMISQYLYRNYIPIGSKEVNKTFNEYTTNITNNFKPSLPIYDNFGNDSLYGQDNDLKKNVSNILLNPNYGIDFIKTVTRGKISSNFFEQTNLDELSLGNDTDSALLNFFKNSDYLKLFDIPIFLNNLKNSNVLDIQFTNSEIYLNGIKLAIDSNFAKAYIASINKNVDLVNVDGLNLKSIFDKYAEILDEIDINQIKELREILMYQLYLAKEQNKTFVDSPVNPKEGYEEQVRTKFDNQVNFIRFLTSIEPQPIEVEKENSLARQIDNPFRSDTRLETQEELESRLKKKFGKIIPQAKIKEILRKFSSLVGLSKTLVIKSGGDINIDVLLLGKAISDLKIEAKLNSGYNVNLRQGFTKTPLTGGTFRDNFAVEASLNEDFQIESSLSFINVLFNIFDIRTVNSKGFPDGVVFKPKQFGLYQENIASELWKHLNKQAIKLSIKTLPFFHLSNIRLVNYKPCFLFSKQITPINPNSKSTSNNLDFFSGVYNIAAIKHVINTKECYSQFMLIKETGNSPIL